MNREYNVSDTCRILNVARTTLHYWIEDGRIKAHKTPSGHYRVRHEELVRFMNDNDMPLDLIEQTMAKRVLVVDDDEGIIKILTGALETIGEFKVESATNAFDAGFQACYFRPHAVVLDIRLGSIDGRHVCRQIKNTPELKKTIMVAISGEITREEENELEAVGFDAYFRKPVDLPEFVETIQKLVRGAPYRRKPLNMRRPPRRKRK